MNKNPLGETTDSFTSFSTLPFVLLLFVGSGCSALIYEIVWFQLLQLVIGSTAVSLAVLLGTFMGGMCLGSIGLPWVISSRHHPLRVYAWLELGIGIIGVALLFGMPFISRMYTGYFGAGMSGVIPRAIICTLCLLPPTILMGATLPAIARWMKTTPEGVSRLGFFYGANIAGAVFGCLLAGFYLLRVHDTTVATYAAAALNVAVAVCSLGLAFLTDYQAREEESTGWVERAPDSWTIYVAIGLSGLCALGCEVIWTRLLSLMLGATVYTFSIILAAFLIGLGIGSSVASALSRSMARPRVALGLCQLLLTASIAWSAYMLTRSIPYWPVDPQLTTSPWFIFQLDMVRCLWAALPATCLWGASFPLALAAVASRGQDAGRLVGGVYAANTVGAILGATGCSLLLIAWLGTQRTHQVLIGLSALAAIVVFMPLLWQQSAGKQLRFFPSRVGGVVAVFAALGMGFFAQWMVPGVPPGLVAYGRHLAGRAYDEQYSGESPPKYLYSGEGMNASIAVSETSYGVRNFHVSGKVVASSEPQDMRLQLMLGHIPTLLHPNPESVLVVGCGAGVTAGSFVLHPGIKRIVICEIEPLIPPAAREYFREENYGVVEDPRVEVILDDARHYIATTNDTFDIITSDPIHPWVKGAAALYSREYFELCKKRLNPGGVVTQWVPLYETNLAAVKSEFATFFDAFPHGTIWSNDDRGRGYDIVLLGQQEKTVINLDAIKDRLARDDHLAVAESLWKAGFQSGMIDMLRTYAGRPADLTEWLKDAEITHDRNMRLQYLAGMGLNAVESESIFDSFVEHIKFPDDLFTGSEKLIDDLYDAWVNLEPENPAPLIP